VSGYGNAAYNPATAGSGRAGSTGVYELALRDGSTIAARNAALVRVMGFRDEPAVVRSAAFAALASAATLPASPGSPSRRR